MFTGLIEAVGQVAALTPKEGVLRIEIHAPGLAGRLKVGDSVAVSGVCLTALEPTQDSFHAELAAETIARTSLAGLKTGDRVNLELPTPAGTPLGGHVVQGHVDATGTLLSLEPVASGPRTDWVLRLAVPPAVGRYVVEKGSIAIEGISLTIARWFPERDAQDDTRNGAGELHVAIIPHTYEATNLRTLGPGAALNLEADVLMKLAVERGLGAVSTPGDQPETAWTRRAEADTAADTAFVLTTGYLIANGY